MLANQRTWSKSGVASNSYKKSMEFYYIGVLNSKDKVQNHHFIVINQMRKIRDIESIWDPTGGVLYAPKVERWVSVSLPICLLLNLVQDWSHLLLRPNCTVQRQSKSILISVH